MGYRSWGRKESATHTQAMAPTVGNEDTVHVVLKGEGVEVLRIGVTEPERPAKPSSIKICGSKAFKHHIGGKRLTQVIDASESMASHRHGDALKKQRLSFFEKFI